MHNRPAPDLFARLPGHFRTRDAAQGRPLQALMADLAEEIRILEQDIDQLYDNWFVETCEPWVLPYIAALIGATPMREIGADQQGLLRAYIANVLRFRQAKGTAAVAEEVAGDVSGWAVVAVEFFRRLATSQHMNHVRADAPAFASLRDGAAARISRDPFSTMPHSAAAGTPSGWSGRYNIPHLGLFIWRHSAAPLWPVAKVDDPGVTQPGYLGGAMPSPGAPDPGRLPFDPLGRELPILNRPAPDVSLAARMSADTVPSPLSRDAVAAALDPVGWKFDPQNAPQAGPDDPKPKWDTDTAPFRIRLDGTDVEIGDIRCCNLEKKPDGTWHRPDAAGKVLIDPELGVISLHPSDEGKPVETGYAAAHVFDIGGGVYDRRASVEKWLPDYDLPGEPPPWQIGVSKIAGLATNDPLQGGPVVATLREAVAAWNAHAQANPGARGIIAVMDNATYAEALNANRRIVLPKGSRLAIVASAWPGEPGDAATLTRKPGRLAPEQRRPYLRGPVMIEAEDAGNDTAGSLVIDGLLIGGNVSARPGGDLGLLRLYNCTVGATEIGLERAVRATADNTLMSLVVDRCIVSRIDLPLATGALEITRSIVGEDRTAGGGGAGAGTLAIRAPRMDAEISGCTIFGRAELRSISAENAILSGRVEVEHRQTGCVRFSYVPLASALPRRYRCVPRVSDDPKPRPIFASTRYADPEFGMLSLTTPKAILEGAEDGMEMGVGFFNRDPARRANIRDAIREFSPFGLTPGLIFMPLSPRGGPYFDEAGGQP